MEWRWLSPWAMRRHFFVWGNSIIMSISGIGKLIGKAMLIGVPSEPKNQSVINQVLAGLKSSRAGPRLLKTLLEVDLVP
jgi:hypothetical protein